MTISETFLVESLDWDYNKSYFQQTSLAGTDNEVDSLSPLQKNFSERVRLLTEENNVGSFLVDSRVLVTGPSDALRAAAVKNWEFKRDQANWWGRFHTVVAVGSLVGAALSSPFVAEGAIVFIAVATAIAFFANAFFAAKNFKRTEASQGQINQWNKHPAESVASARANAFRQGFFYSMNNGFKGDYRTISPQNILHPSEVTWLYEQNLANMMKDVNIQAQRQNVNSNEKKRWVEQFIAQNPLSLKAIEYAYEPQDPKRQILEAWCPSFEAYREDVSSVQKFFAEKASQIERQMKKESSRLEAQRSLALAHPLSIKKASNEEAQRLCKEQEAVEGLSEEARKAVTARYDKVIKDNNDHYSVISKPINTYYDQCIKDVKDWREECLQQIEREKAVAIDPYFQPALTLFTRAYDSWEKGKYDSSSFYRGQEFLFPALRPLPSAPPLDDERKES